MFMQSDVPTLYYNICVENRSELTGESDKFSATLNYDRLESFVKGTLTEKVKALKGLTKKEGSALEKGDYEITLHSLVLYDSLDYHECGTKEKVNELLGEDPGKDWTKFRKYVQFDI